MLKCIFLQIPQLRTTSCIDMILHKKNSPTKIYVTNLVTFLWSQLPLSCPWSFYNRLSYLIRQLLCTITKLCYTKCASR